MSLIEIQGRNVKTRNRQAQASKDQMKRERKREREREKHKYKKKKHKEKEKQKKKKGKKKLKSTFLQKTVVMTFMQILTAGRLTSELLAPPFISKTLVARLASLPNLDVDVSSIDWRLEDTMCTALSSPELNAW